MEHRSTAAARHRAGWLKTLECRPGAHQTCTGSTSGHACGCICHVPFHRGDLVLREDGYYAVVLEDLGPTAELFLSNGLRELVAKGSFQPVPIRATGSWSSFHEILKEL